MDDDTADAMAAAMGFSSFGAQNLPSKKRKYNPNNDAVVSIDNPSRHGTSANSAPVGERRAPPANADEIALALDDQVDDDDGANNNGEAGAVGEAKSASADAAGGGSSHGIGAGIAGLPQRPVPARGGFASNQHRRGGAPRHASGGHHGINKLWYEDYYDHFSNENPWAKLEEASGLQPMSTWFPVHTSKEEVHQARAA